MSSMHLLLKMPKKVLVQFLTDRRTAILKTGTALRPGVYPEVHKEVEVLWGGAWLMAVVVAVGDDETALAEQDMAFKSHGTTSVVLMVFML